MKNLITFLFICLIGITTYAQDKFKAKLNKKADKIEKEVIEWRRHFHQNPELSNREFKTSKKIAEQLRKLGLEVKTGIAHTGS